MVSLQTDGVSAIKLKGKEWKIMKVTQIFVIPVYDQTT